MIVLNPRFDAERFFAQLAETTRRVLFLDYDGTLAPFTTERDKAFPYPGVRSLLDQLLELPSNRVVIISGRAVDALTPLLGLRTNPEIWGSHGLERLLPDGTYVSHPLDDQALQAIADAESVVSSLNLGDLTERKPAGLALHTRGLGIGEARGIIERVLSKWNPLVESSDLSIHDFAGGIELRFSQTNKGHAVGTVLAEFSEPPPAAYFGDDLTDEDAFRVLKGKGMGVLVRHEYRRTEADVWVTPPDGLIQLLKHWLAD